MEKYHLGIDDGEKYPCNGISQINSDFPQPCLELADQRHANRPAYLHGLDFDPYLAPVSRGSSVSHSRTGSLPASVQKNLTLNVGGFLLIW